MSSQRSDVAVIGGGIIGLSVARELRRAGVARVCVMEREASLGAGSSSRANGGIRAQFTTPANVSFSLHSIQELENLTCEYPDELSFRQHGYLLFTARQETADGLRAAARLQRSLGVETEWLAPESVATRAPIVRPEGLTGAAFHARDGYLDPHGLISLVANEARRSGADIRTGAEVSSIRPAGGGFELVAGGTTHVADCVVNAAGAHARAISAMVGVDLPVEPVRRNLAYVHAPEPVPAKLPMCVDLDTGVLVRPEGSEGYVVAYSDPADAPGWDTSLDPDFLPALSSRIGNRFPLLAGHPIHPKHCWAGLYPETPDGHAIIGEVPGVPGFVQCAGFGGHGLMHSFAAGRAVAELVVDGRCTTFDLHALRPTRFEEGDVVRETAVL